MQCTKVYCCISGIRDQDSESAADNDMAGYTITGDHAISVNTASGGLTDQISSQATSVQSFHVAV